LAAFRAALRVLADIFGVFVKVVVGICFSWGPETPSASLLWYQYLRKSKHVLGYNNHYPLTTIDMSVILSQLSIKIQKHSISNRMRV